ncbi:MAG: hypothetical protein K2O12_03550, partial [Muribaculaceae bacterium]|nr:hypothetical protein [Muribaculaceae bacterium]
MRHHIIMLAAAACLIGGAPANAQEQHQCCGQHKQGQGCLKNNPFVKAYPDRFEIPPFESIQIGDYMPAVKAGIKQHKAEIEAIATNPAEPTFENTILAMDESGQLLDRVMRVLMSLNETCSSPELVAVTEEAMPLYSLHQDEIMMDSRLFARVKKLYDMRESAGYDVAQKRAVENTYKDFTRNGALLDADSQEKLKEIN